MAVRRGLRADSSQIESSQEKLADVVDRCPKEARVSKLNEDDFITVLGLLTIITATVVLTLLIRG